MIMKKMAEISNTTIDVFVRMENSDTNTKVDDYITVLLNIKNHEVK